ncbi:hypothetical protein BY996DRAFT_6478593 [Phakopsora pachyrhizi]|nr:hypothetical protein BY996DRAFT_6478593 [Phakopsora pachyrhizi]
MPSEFSPPDDFAILAPFDNCLAKADHPRHVQSAYQLHVVVEDLVKRVGGKEVKGGLQERCKEVFEEGVAVEGNRWCHWKEEQSRVLTKVKVVGAKLQEPQTCKRF